MSNPLTITVQNDNSKPLFVIRQGKKAVGSFRATLVNGAHRGVGSAFTAIIMRILTGFSVNVSGKILHVDGDSIVGDNLVTEVLRNLSQDPFYNGRVPMTVSTMYHTLEKGNQVTFLDDRGCRISTMPFHSRSSYQVSYSKYAS